MLPSEIVNPTIKLLYLLGFLAQAKPDKKQSTSLMTLCMQAYKSHTQFMWTTNGFTKKLSIDYHHRILSRKTPLQEQFDGE